MNLISGSPKIHRFPSNGVARIEEINASGSRYTCRKAN
jgi:hypothetical protein